MITLLPHYEARLREPIRVEIAPAIDRLISMRITGRGETWQGRITYHCVKGKIRTLLFDDSQAFDRFLERAKVNERKRLAHVTANASRNDLSA